MPGKELYTKSGAPSLLRFLRYALVSSAVAATPAVAQQGPGNFYRGKTINVYIGYSPGGGYDTYTRMIAQYIGRHIPGAPAVIPQNMPGGGSRVVSAYMASIAPKDGTALASADQSLALQQALGDETIKFDNRRFNWIGNPDQDNNTVVTWHTSGIRSIEDARHKEVTLAATGPNTTSAQYPVVLNEMFGTKFKVVNGYPGANDANLAMERGEVAGRGSYGWGTGKATRPDWPSEGKINVIVQIGLAKSPELPNVPLLMDLAKNEADRGILKLLSAPIAIGKPLFTTPDVPQDRVVALRNAFMMTMKDEDFLAFAAKTNTGINPISGAQLQKVVADVIDAPLKVRERLRDLLARAQ